MKKNIAIIIQKLTGGGAERVAANLSKILSENYNVYLYVFNTDRVTYDYNGLIRRIDKNYGKGFWGKFINIIKRVLKIKMLKKQDKIDVSISLLTFGNLVNILSCNGESTIISIRNNVNKLSPILERYCASIAVGKANKVVALSKSVEKQIGEQFGNQEKVCTIYNPIPVFNYDEVRQSEFSCRYFVTTGRLTKQKGQWHLIKAMYIIKQKYPDVRLFILGEGELRDRLSALIVRMGLEKNVVLYGYSSDPKPIVKGAVAFVFPSLFEGLGNSIVEALALQKCVISVDCPHGPAELLNESFYTEHADVIEGKYGILTPAFDDSMDFSCNITDKEKALACAMLKVLEDDNLRKHYEQQARLRARDFSEKIISQQWINIIEELF